jgi:hypothetical protein
LALLPSIVSVVICCCALLEVVNLPHIDEIGDEALIGSKIDVLG